MEKPEKLKPVTAEGRDGRVLVKFADEHGKEFAIDLSIFDVSMLVSALYAAREKALKQPPGNKPKVMLPVDKLEFGKAETSKGLVQVLRVYVTDKLFQDFAVSAELVFAGQGGRQAMSRRRLSTSAESFGTSR